MEEVKIHTCLLCKTKFAEWLAEYDCENCDYGIEERESEFGMSQNFEAAGIATEQEKMTIWKKHFVAKNVLWNIARNK